VRLAEDKKKSSGTPTKGFKRGSKDEQRTLKTSKPSILAEEPRLPLPF
jgi:hypothetical protein